MNRRHHFTLLVLALTWCLRAEPRAATQSLTYRNPVLDASNAADPHVIRVDGKYYLYPTLDGKGYDVFVSDDLVHWEKKPKCFTDPRGGAWAPDVFHHTRGDNRFYLYYTLDNPQKKRGAKLIGVAVSVSPLGPFVDKGTLAEDAIDAHLFQDDDGQMYLYYVHLANGFRILVQPMKDPLTRADSRPLECLNPTQPWEMHGKVTEGPFMLKRDKRYYLMYSGSGANGPYYGLGYATSTSPLGPFEKFNANPIAKAGNGIWGPGHHCVVTGPDGKLWMLYHQKLDDQVNWKRFVALDPIWFDEKGVIHTRLSRETDQPRPRLDKPAR